MGSITDVTQSTPALDFSTFDTDVRVQDDLFRHVNGTWIEQTPIPDDKPLTGSFMVLRDAAEAAVRDIITGMDRASAPAGSDEAKIADLYASFLATDTIEAAGAQPISELLARIDGVAEVSELVELMGALARVGVRGLVGVDTESDPGDPNRYVMFVGQSGIGLPDEAYYREDEYADVREAYQGHIGRMLEHIGIDYPAAHAQQIVELETDIAACHWDKVKTRDMRLMYNLTSLSDFSNASPALHWRTFMAGAEIDERHMAELVVEQPSFFTDVATLLTENRLPTWKIWLKWRVIGSYAPYLSSAIVAENFAFYGTTLQGTPQLRERWKRGVGLVEGALGEAVGKVYVERHFSPVAKQRMDELVANLIKAYHSSITELAWMTEETKAEALTKLAKFRPHIGFPPQVARLLCAPDRRRRPARQRAASVVVRAGPVADQDRPAGRPGGVADDTADGQRLLPPAEERDRVPSRHPAAARSSTSTPTTPSTTAGSAR